MNLTHKRSYLHYTALGIIVVAIYLLQSGVGTLPRVFSVCAIPLIPTVVCISMFEGHTAGFVYGLFAGLMMDVVSGRLSCFNTLFLMLTGVVIGLLIDLLINNTPLSALFLSGITCIVYYLVYWAAFILPANVTAAFGMLLRFSLIGAVYAWIFTLPIYLMLRALSLREQRNSRNQL